ncbi:flagellar motor switch phosphatase FliY [Tissierella sp.]|uniref:flagellar motor switch phosphatase FliY n=1 Tax=Tissierella sp. TaxID=41274 RepID=UPI002862D17F|nr:flagellar motor switch phosphatase FliY [Tissierella sp.]MDR7856259.1 flagellar motor switch phosphatase FliY [Tissierella sp.]
MASDMLSQEEIDALLKGDSNNDVKVDFYEDEDDNENNIDNNNEDILSILEIDALGEIGNISMGTAATTLSTLLNKKVSITTPKVIITTADDLADEYKLPLVAIDVSYKAGLQGSNVLILDSNDAKIITDLMMGKDDFDTTRELTELDLSAVSEAMNQMMGSASTSLSEMFMKKIDIEPPRSLEMTLAEGKNQIDLLSSNSSIIKISFKMVIGDIIDSNIMQLIPLEFGKHLVDSLMSTSSSNNDVVVPDFISEPENISFKEPSLANKEEKRHNISQNYSRPVDRTTNVGYNGISRKEEKVIITKPEFQTFEENPNLVYNESLDLVGDIPVEITVELGRTSKRIGEILELGQGTVLELDKLVGEALSIYANGKYIAKGEVIVIDDNFGVRVTEIENSNKKIIEKV